MKISYTEDSSCFNTFGTRTGNSVKFAFLALYVLFYKNEYIYIYICIYIYIYIYTYL